MRRGLTDNQKGKIMSKTIEKPNADVVMPETPIKPYEWRADPLHNDRDTTPGANKKESQ